MDGEGTSAGRLHMYKTKGLNLDECRKKRREIGVQIRKQKRHEILENRRKISQFVFESGSVSAIPADILQQLRSETYHCEENSINYICEKLRSDKLTVDDLSVHGVFSMLSEIYCNRQNEVLRSAIRSIILQVARIPQDSKMKETDCVKALCFILSQHEESTNIVCDMLQSISVFVGVNAAFRNVAFDMAIVPCLLNAYEKNDVRLSRCVMWLVSQLFHRLYDYSPCVEEVAPLLEIVSDGMKSSDEVIQCDAIRACALMAEWQDIWPEMQSSKILPPTGQFFIFGTRRLFTEEMVDCGLLEILRPLIFVRYLARDVCFILSNISSEVHMIGKIISAGFLSELTKIMEFSNFDTRKEAAYTMCHCCSSTEAEHMVAVLECGALRAFTDLLTVMDPTLVLEILDALDQLLSFGERDLAPDYTNPVATKLEQLGGRRKLEFLTESQHVEIHVRAYALIDRYFDDDELVGLNPCSSEIRSSVDATIEAVLATVAAQDS
ncbi:unnamed protein product [Caenorhabditis auriculariae]|uniref:IBB domain-containing protein n=1 Tax=Caenorhabditis auriculariae TaxID=2777116 RepID=A0A8S1HWM3_9PELO|nr:unnamed protein product [Caenorhabditis auriculariae]